MKTLEERYREARILIIKGKSIEESCIKVGISFNDYIQVREKEHEKAMKIESNITFKAWSWIALFMIVALAGYLLWLLIT